MRLNGGIRIATQIPYRKRITSGFSDDFPGNSHNEATGKSQYRENYQPSPKNFTDQKIIGGNSGKIETNSNLNGVSYENFL